MNQVTLQFSQIINKFFKRVSKAKPDPPPNRMLYFGKYYPSPFLCLKSVKVYEESNMVDDILPNQSFQKICILLKGHYSYHYLFSWINQTVLPVFSITSE